MGGGGVHIPQIPGWNKCEKKVGKSYIRPPCPPLKGGGVGPTRSPTTNTTHHPTQRPAQKPAQHTWASTTHISQHITLKAIYFFVFWLLCNGDKHYPYLHRVPKKKGTLPSYSRMEGTHQTTHTYFEELEKNHDKLKKIAKQTRVRQYKTRVKMQSTWLCGREQRCTTDKHALEIKQQRHHT